MFISIIKKFSVYISIAREKKKRKMNFLSFQCWKLNLNIFASLLPMGVVRSSNNSSEIVQIRKKTRGKKKKKLILIMGFKFSSSFQLFSRFATVQGAQIERQWRNGWVETKFHLSVRSEREKKGQQEMNNNEKPRIQLKIILPCPI